MAWDIQLHPDLPIIVTRYSESVSPPELMDAINETLEWVRTHGRTRLLADCTALAGGHSVVDLFAAVESFKDNPLISSLREAVLLPAQPESADGVRFWENAGYNRGLQVRTFQAREEALAWLMGF